MAGGGGNHFWPLSREDRPKQFIGLGVSGRTFLQHAYQRCEGLVPKENILVITLARYRDRNYLVTAFVNRLYTKVLARDYDETGLEYWTKLLITHKAF